MLKEPNPDKPMTVIGLMSGTSVDAIDACCVSLRLESHGQLAFDIQGTATVKLPTEVRKQVMGMINVPEVHLASVCSLNASLGEYFAEAALKVMKTCGLTPQDIDAIGSHGQTVYHIPPGSKEHCASTLQIGEPSVIAERTGVLTVADFRPRDMAAGGQGAPLVCFADQLLFQLPDRARCVQNIGGIANVTLLPPRGAAPPIAFDTGPGNMLIDEAMDYLYSKPMDRGGKIAAKGRVNDEVLGHLLKQSYLRVPPPKTTGREAFGRSFVLDVLQAFDSVSKTDMITTLTHYTAVTIAQAYENFILPHQTVDEVIVGGGGSYNDTLMSLLSDQLARVAPELVVKTHEDYGIPNQYKEALAFAVLAWATLNRIPGNLPSCTGAKHGTLLGKIVPGAL